MPFAFQESLDKLRRLSPDQLHQTSLRLRAELGGAEWRLSLCLLAASRNSSFRALGYSSIRDYGERGLQLSAKKTYSLLSAARALEHLPLLSLAFQLGEIDWAKIRAIQSLATPETEAQWLEFALRHRTDELVRLITLCPDRWKRQRALKASLVGEPDCTSEEVAEVLASATYQSEAASPAECNGGSMRPEDSNIATPSASTHANKGVDTTGLIADQPARSSALSQKEAAAEPLEPPIFPAKIPTVIRFVIELTPDQYAVYERAEHRVRAQEKKRVPRAIVLTRMAEALLNSGSARSRAKHQVLIHTLEGSELAWYDTDRGILPVASDVLKSASQHAGLHGGTAGKPVLEEGSLAAVRPDLPTRLAGRTPIPNGILRQLFARARHRCERCGLGGSPLDAHHARPVSEGGDNSLETLELVCKACHSLEHQSDFAEKPHWRDARAARQRRSAAGDGADSNVTARKRTDRASGAAKGKGPDKKLTELRDRPGESAASADRGAATRESAGSRNGSLETERSERGP